MTWWQQRQRSEPMDKLVAYLYIWTIESTKERHETLTTTTLNVLVEKASGVGRETGYIGKGKNEFGVGILYAGAWLWIIL